MNIPNVKIIERYEDLLYESGLTADGCWNQLDQYAKEAIDRYGKLCVESLALKLFADGIIDRFTLMDVREYYNLLKEDSR